MQRCLEKGLDSQRKQLAEVIVSYLPLLLEDPYGNYLVQNVIKLDFKELNRTIFKYIASNFYHFSKQKFSSNVIECVSILLLIFLDS